MAVEYRYDVFVSYPRAWPVGDWVHNHLVHRLKGLLGGELPHEPRVFVDR